MTFGKVLTEVRKKAGFKQKDLALVVKKEDGTSISAAYLNDLEHDRRYPPSDYLIEQFANALNVPESYLYYYAGRFPPIFRGRLSNIFQVVKAFEAFIKVIDSPD